MAMKPLPDQDLLRQLLDYDPATGILTWKPRPPEMFLGERLTHKHASKIWNSRFSGNHAFNSHHRSGYRFGRLGGTNFMAHRIIWKMVHGFDPKDIDHISGDKADNRLINLRAVGKLGNAKNMPRPSNNTSGHIGVYFCKCTSRWRVELIANGKKIRVGRFDTLEEAATARRKAALAHGFHRNHGR